MACRSPRHACCRAYARRAACGPASRLARPAVFETETKGLRLVCDAKSLLYLFGMRLDFSDALVGGGFQFHNPNAEKTCGCGKSFGT